MCFTGLADMGVASGRIRHFPRFGMATVTDGRCIGRQLGDGYEVLEEG